MTLKAAIDRVTEYYFGDQTKTMEWLQSPICDFHGKSPMQMIHARKEKKIIAYIFKHFP